MTIAPFPANRLYIADELDPSLESPKISLTALDEGASQGFGLADTPDFGGIETETEIISQPPAPGGVVAVRHHPLTTMVLPLYMEGFASMGEMFQHIEFLAEELDKEGVVVWIPKNSVDIRLIDYYPSPLANLIRGQERALQKIANLLQEGDGYPVEVTRHPYARGREIEGTFQTLSNVANQRTYLMDNAAQNPGNATALARVIIEPASNAALVEARIARRSRAPSQFAAVATTEIESGTAYQNTAPDTVQGGSGGANMKTAFTTNFSTMMRRWRLVIHPAEGRAIEGIFNVKFVIRPGTDWKGDVQLRWGVADVDPAPTETTNQRVILDNEDSTVSQFIEIDAGQIRVPTDADVLVLEGWASRRSTAGDLYWDTVILQPADEQVLLGAVPGFRLGAVGLLEWKGEEMIGSGPGLGGHDSKHGDSKILDEASHNAFTAPSAGMGLATGLYLAHFDITLQNNQTNSNDVHEAVRMATAYVQSSTDAFATAGTVVTSKGLRTKRGKQFTNMLAKMVFEVLQADVDAGKTYRYGVEADSANYNAGGRKTFVRKIKSSYLRTVAGGSTARSQQVSIDAFRRSSAVQLKQTEDRTEAFLLEGPFLEVPSEDTLLVFTFGEAPLPNFQYQQVDEREPMSRIRYDRTYKVRVDLTPRYMPI